MQNFGEMINHGAVINESIKKYLKLEKWTPAMGALLICGIKAPDHCNEIPHDGVGLDGLSLDASNSRFHDARRILEELGCYNEEDEPLLLEFSPIEFFIWCDQENIKTDWLRLFLKISGCSAPADIDLTPSHFALLSAPSTTAQTVSERKDSKAIDPAPGKQPRTCVGKLAIKAAWEIQNETGRKATSHEVIKRLQGWAETGDDGCLVGKIPSGVTWMPLRKNKSKPYDIEACGKALKAWHASLTLKRM
ncbi:MAG: hypothetical protein WC091_01850 [Sulfuricellaceae bacterium]